MPSGALFKSYGRYWGFSFGCFCQLAGSAIGSFAMIADSLILLFAGCFCVGLGQGLGQFYRFAAVEVASEGHKSKAVTFVLTGGVLAAFLGPSSANYTKDFTSHEYFGSFLSMGVIGLLNWAVVALVNFPPPAHAQAGPGGGEGPRQRKSRPLREICTTPIFVLSCTVATIAHTVMVRQRCLASVCLLLLVKCAAWCPLILLLFSPMRHALWLMLPDVSSSGDDHVQLHHRHGRRLLFPDRHAGAGAALLCHHCFLLPASDSSARTKKRQVNARD